MHGIKIEPTPDIDERLYNAFYPIVEDLAWGDTKADTAADKLVEEAEREILVERELRSCAHCRYWERDEDLYAGERGHCTRIPGISEIRKSKTEINGLAAWMHADIFGVLVESDLFLYTRASFGCSEWELEEVNNG